jgi:pyruvate dehydrogenase E2 component (dihydrolipoamide acetyltransferase)
MSKITVPDLGDFHDVEVIDVMVKPGDKIDVDTPLITLETEKATMDVPATAAGVVKEVVVKKGDRVSKGSVILEVEEGGVQSAAAEAPAPQSPASATPPPAKAEVRESAPAASASAAPQQVQITVPDIGDFKDVEVVEVMVKPGDTIEVDTPLITLETEKATMDVPATAAGRVKSVAVKKGDRVSKGSLILEVEGASAVPTTPASPEPERKAQAQPTAASVPSAPEAPRPELARPASPATVHAIDEAGFSRAHASPSVRKLARELGVDLSRVKGTGIKGRITPEDVKAWVKQTLTQGAAGAGGAAALPKVPEVDFAKFGEIEVKPLGRIQRISGPRLHASWLNIPHVWQMDEADITELEETRNRLKEEAAKRGIKLTPLAFILRACVKALQEFPFVNSSLDPAGQNLILKKYIHLGFAADTPNGLVVPVIRDADRKDIYELARDLGTLSAKARDGKLTAAEMQGASFTVSSLGGIGGTAFTPIINAPEVAILGVSRSYMKPVYKNGQFVPRLILPFTFAYDHRVIDGAAGVRFTTFLAQKLADVAGLLEAVP